MNADLLTTLLADNIMLKAKIVGLTDAVLGICICLMRGETSLDEQIRILEIMRIRCAVLNSDAEALPLADIIGLLTAIQKSGADPYLALLVRALTHLDTRPELRASLQSWLSQAHPDELADDLRELLLKYGIPLPPADDAQNNGSERS